MKLSVRISDTSNSVNYLQRKKLTFFKSLQLRVCLAFQKMSMFQLTQEMMQLFLIVFVVNKQGGFFVKLNTFLDSPFFSNF